MSDHYVYAVETTELNGCTIEQLFENQRYFKSTDMLHGFIHGRCYGKGALRTGREFEDWFNNRNKYGITNDGYSIISLYITCGED